ncbi:fer3 [Brachionus plicatilis]|uniref:Fer3 n=1 Tax=Brachionus plicatilis TaxID=10195 RepID=A0A3M7S2H2_BRAPC|nr:fer3 [Brachionus plicatilis]
MFFESNMIKSELVESFEDQSKLMGQWLNDLEASPSSSCSLPDSPFNFNAELLQSSYTDNQYQTQHQYEWQFQQNPCEYESFPTQFADYGSTADYYNPSYYQSYNRSDYSYYYPTSCQNVDTAAQFRNSIELDNSNISASFSCSLTETDDDDLIEHLDNAKRLIICGDNLRQTRKQMSSQMDECVSAESNAKRKRKRILNRMQRAEATMREKRRMLKLNKAFEELRKVLPISEFAKNKLSRSETLKSAIEYIERMSQLLSI